MADSCPPHVLFIDDPATRDLATRVLSACGWQVTALAAPDLGPDEVARLAPDAVVLVSAATYAVAQDRDRIDRLADQVLLKPYGLGELRGAVARLLAPAPV